MTELVRFEDVTVRYDGEPVLEHVDLSIEEAAFLGVVGPSGSGKTTLLRAITGSVRPVAGRLTHPEGRVSVGYVPQVETVNWYFPVSVLDTLLMGRIRGRRAPWASAD